MTPPEFLLPKEAARLLRVTEKTLRKWTRGPKPTLPCLVLGRGARRTIRFHRQTLLAVAQGKAA
jgi:hypothetical protein